MFSVKQCVLFVVGVTVGLVVANVLFYFVVTGDFVR